MTQISSIQALEQQRVLLRLEYETEKEEFRQQTEERGVARLVKRGDVWLPLRVGNTFYNSLNQLAVEVFRTDNQDIEHNFEYGRPVTFFRMVPDEHHPREHRLHYFDFPGVVSYVDGDRMVVAVPEGHQLDIQGCADPVGVHFFFDETTYRMMFDALDRVVRAKNNRLAYLRDLFYSHQPAQTFSFEPTRFPRLNTTQGDAVNQAQEAKDVEVVQGPHGTG